MTYVGYAFRGVQIAVVYLIGSAGIKVIKGLKKNVFSIVIACAVFVAFILLSLFAVSFSSVFYVLIAGVLGLTVYLIGYIREKRTSLPAETSLPDEEKSEGKDSEIDCSNKEDAE